MVSPCVCNVYTLASAMDEIAEEAGHKEKMKEAIKAHIKKQLFFNDKAGTYHPIYEKRIKEPNIYRSVADIEDPSELARDPAQYQYYLKYKEDYKELADYLDDYWNEHPEYKEKCVREYFGQYHEEYLKSKDKEEIDIKDEELSRIFENFYIISHDEQEKIIDILNNERERLLKYFLSPRTMQLSENLKKIRGALSTKKSLENMVCFKRQLLERIENEIQDNYVKRIRRESVQKNLFLDEDIKGRVSELFFIPMKQKDVHSEYFFGEYLFSSLELLNILCLSSKEIREEFAYACSREKKEKLFLYSVDYRLNREYFGDSFIEGKDENYRKNFQELKELL